ncbi:MAG TPA: hypothetical protein VF838_08045 [Trebonia sp.]
MDSVNSEVWEGNSEVVEGEQAPPAASRADPPFLARITRPLAARLPGPLGQGALAFALYLGVFVIGFGLPLARHLNQPNLRQYWTDVQFYAWSLRWWPYAVSHGVNPLFSSQIGAPHGYSLAWASTAPSVDLLMWPVTAAFGVLVSYNVVLLLVPPVSAWAAFVLARRLTGRFWPSLLAGAVYGFCPYELMHNWQGQPNLTVTGLFPLMAYLVLRWWDGTLGRTWFVVWLTLAMAVQFYTFNEAFAEMTAVWTGALVAGFAVAGRPARWKVARLAGLAGLAYAGSVLLAAPYLIYSFRHYQAGLTRQQPAFSLPLVRLILPASQHLFGFGPLINYSNRIGDGGIENYVGIPLIVIMLALAAWAWRNRISLLLLAVFLFVIALAVGPNLVVTTVRHVHPLPWAGLWSLPVARSAEPSRFIVFGVLALAVALALWLAAPSSSRPLLAARWCLGLLAVAAVITDTPTSYSAVQPVPPGYPLQSIGHPVNRLPAFLTDGMYRRYLRPGEIVVVLTGRGNAGMLFQADAGFYFRIAGGYINASLTPVNALPHPVTLLAHPSAAAIRMFDSYARSAGLGAIIVEQAWEAPWMDLGKLGMRGMTAGGVTIYPMRPWLAREARTGQPRRHSMPGTLS